MELCRFQWLEEHQNTSCTQKQPHSWQECQATTKTVLHDTLCCSGRSGCFYGYYCLSLKHMYLLVPMRLYSIIENNCLLTALYCSICWASKYLNSGNKHIFRPIYSYKWVGFSSSLIYKCIEYGLESPCSGFHDNRPDIWDYFFPYFILGGKELLSPSRIVWWASKMIVLKENQKLQTVFWNTSEKCMRRMAPQIWHGLESGFLYTEIQMHIYPRKMQSYTTLLCT